MSVHPGAGRPAPADLLVDLDALFTSYTSRVPDAANPQQRVSFGTSGHRGSSLAGTFNEAHVLAITQAICDYRRDAGISGPLFLGRDTHGLSTPAFENAVEVLSANGVTVMVDSHDGYTPTPVVSHAILRHNRLRSADLADGILLTPSHNPPDEGGIKYNPPTGGPADTSVTRFIEDRANDLLARDTHTIARTPYEQARDADTTSRYDYLATYVDDLDSVVDMDLIQRARLTIGVHPLGGASIAFWQRIADRYDIALRVVDDRVDPTFRFMSLDWDGKIRMDCSSPYAMAPLVELRRRFDIAFANDPDADRHGIVTPGAGLMNPNHYLAVAISYLFTHRPGWPAGAGVGKTAVSSSVIDRVATRLGRRLVEVPVGFKWFVPGLVDGSLGFGGEESAGASFLRRDGSVWTTDKDGMVMNLLAVELMARLERDPSAVYSALTEELGESWYERIDGPVTPDQKAALLMLSADDVSATTLAGDRIVACLTTAPGNGASLGGLKVVTEDGWFAARPSGTEAVYKLYAESFRGRQHLRRIQDEADIIIKKALVERKSLSSEGERRG
jgi:phosphoglucomutase